MFDIFLVGVGGSKLMLCCLSNFACYNGIDKVKYNPVIKINFHIMTSDQGITKFNWHSYIYNYERKNENKIETLCSRYYEN